MKHQTLSRPIAREIQAMKQNTVKPSEFNKSIVLVTAVLLAVFGLISFMLFTYGNSIY